MQKLLAEVILSQLKDSRPEIGLEELDDSGVMEDIVFTTDGHTVNPLFYPGGDIGRLAIRLRQPLRPTPNQAQRVARLVGETGGGLAQLAQMTRLHLQHLSTGPRVRHPDGRPPRQSDADQYHRPGGHHKDTGPGCAAALGVGVRAV